MEPTKSDIDKRRALRRSRSIVTSYPYVPVISVLPSAVADQIAAGEVVERPASVVKELVENSLDAGARSVEITVQEGGRALVRVSDDGGGMDAEDARLSLARHGTSKIRSSADLTGVRTFGFRGEALPAICSVARIEIETALHDGDGTRICAEGGAAPAVTATKRRRGTTVSVTDLFYNSPARARFLRGPRSEWRAISEMVTTLALTRRDVRFDLSHDGRRSISAPPAPSLRVRLGALWGPSYADGLLEVDDVAGPIHVSGLVERPANVGTATRRTFLSVNGRAIRDTGIVRAAESAYRSTIPAGTRPALFLAGRAFVKYRRSGGAKSNVLPDFFIGAHAAVLGCGILTRDARRYTQHFKTVPLIIPEI